MTTDVRKYTATQRVLHWLILLLLAVSFFSHEWMNDSWRALRRTGEATITARYRDAGLDADCRAFIKDMAAEYLAADVIVSRAGATTVAELAIAGKPAILIPYPFAADNHQELNAREMAEGGAALMYRQADLTASILAESLEQLLNDPDRRARMGSAMKALARPAAAATVVDWCVATAERTKA